MTTPVPPIASASTAVWRGDRVLLVQRAHAPYAGVWSLPGGKIEAGETARGTALRELQEETGLSAALGDVADVVDVIDPVRHFVIIVFAAKWLSGEPALNDEAMAAKWFTLGEAESL
ncbi:MAG: NUDIX domain-containing protein, partial [Hyphomicrobiales bacterium]|nr:NUDIX domain-containing protein [Hyphomicrobiales bacterium]